MFIVTIKYHGNLDRDSWLIEWFGLFGRQFATVDKEQHKEPFKRKFTDNPKDIIEFVDEMKRLNLPSWMSVQPFRSYDIPYGIERIFIDFDAPQEEHEELRKEVKRFVSTLRFKPLITKTYKGYHVWGFLGFVLLFPEEDKTLMKYTYGFLIKSILNGHTLHYLDTSVKTDIMRVARIPLSWHEKGCQVMILDENLEPTKVRSIDFYSSYHIPYSEVKIAYNNAVKKLEIMKKERELAAQRLTQTKAPTNGKFDVRACFTKRLMDGEMQHEQRRALLLELYWSGTKNREDIINKFRTLHDFDYDTTAYQVDWFLNPDYPERREAFPYRCKTIKEKKWCLEEQCPIYNKRHK